MKKTMTAIITSLFMGFIGLVLGVLLDEFFGGMDAFVFIIVFPIVFVVITMGAFVLYSIENKK